MSQSSPNPKPVAVVRHAVHLQPLSLSHGLVQVGISAEFPSGTLSETNFDHQSFFDFLLSGKDASERVPADRFNIDGWVVEDTISDCVVELNFSLDGRGLILDRFCRRRRPS